jgi:hypothetical protein
MTRLQATSGDVDTSEMTDLDIHRPEAPSLSNAFLPEPTIFGRQSEPGRNRLRALERVPVKLNRNFLNFPLARDTRAKAEWFQGSKTGCWMADLPGEGRDSHRIRLILPAKASEDMRRCPSALDMNTLFQLLAEAQRKDATRIIEFASLSALLRRLGLEERDRERRRVVESIVQWCFLSIQWERWYEHHGHMRRTLPPPIEYADRKGNRLIITLHPDWYRLARAEGYYLRLPLPLPRQAAAQNLALLILTQQLEGGSLSFDLNQPHADYYFDDLAPLTKEMDRWWIARKLGMLHKQRNRVLDRAIDRAAEWSSVHGGKLKLVAPTADDEDTPSRRIAFRYAAPQAPQRVSSMDRSRGPMDPFGRKLRQARWPAITEQNHTRILKQSEAVQEYLEMDEEAALEGYLAMVRTEGGFRGGGAANDTDPPKKGAVTWSQKGPRPRC